MKHICDEKKNVITPEDCTREATHEVRGYFSLSPNPTLRRKRLYYCDEHARLYNELNMFGLCGKPPAVPIAKPKKRRPNKQGPCQEKYAKDLRLGDWLYCPIGKWEVPAEVVSLDVPVMGGTITVGVESRDGVRGTFRYSPMDTVRLD